MMVFVLVLFIVLGEICTTPVTKEVLNVTETTAQPADPETPTTITLEPNLTLTTAKPSLDVLYTRTRRILRGSQAGDTRPYMVYLRAAEALDDPGGSNGKDSYWLCGGVIIHQSYILTSAACIEDVKNFYVISGTHSWNKEASDCVVNAKKKAVWKCTMEGYNFDGREFDNIQWMESDIAVVKVETPFVCSKRIKGCDFSPEIVRYNNDSERLERPGTQASTAGWGSTLRHQDANNFNPDNAEEASRSLARFAENEPELLEADVTVMNKDKCKKLWPERYHSIIDSSMICTKDITGGSSLCSDQGVKCVDMTNPAVYDEYSSEDPNLLRIRSRKVGDVTNNNKLGAGKGAIAHSFMSHKSLRRMNALSHGGFCENDHGGPLVHGHGRTSVVIGVISACQTKPGSLDCYGPFLYTSVYKHRSLIACATQDAQSLDACTRRGDHKSILRETFYNWPAAKRRHDKKQL